MSSNGSLNGNNVDGSEGSYLDWEVTSQTPGGNYSTIQWYAGWRFAATGCRGLRLGNATVNGVTVYNDSDGGDGVHGFVSGHNHRPKLQTATGSLNIPHNADGTKQFTATVRMTGFSGLLSQGSAIFTLPTINQLPSAPTKPTFSDVRQTSVKVDFQPNNDGGAAVTAYQLGYGLTESANTTTISATPPQMVTGLLPGKTYYFRARAQNAIGWSPWSTITSITTLAGARVNVGGVWKRAIPWVRVGGVWKVARGWVREAGVWKEGA